MFSQLQSWLISLTKPTLKNRPSNEGGFTMIELLVATIVAALIITPILAFVVDVLQSDTQEEVKARAEQELDTAADFIRRDLDQALYIYDNAGVADIKDQLPTDGTPILVFWKQEFVSDVVPPISVEDPSPDYCEANDCDDAQVYALVAYYLRTDDSNTFDGPARITRFQIKDSVKNPADNFLSDLNIEGAERDQGFQALADVTGSSLKERMGNWTKKPDEDYDKSPEVLVDYIDKTAVDGEEINDEYCLNKLGLENLEEEDEELQPLVGDKAGFFVCVDSENTVALVHLRANALARIDEDATTYDKDKKAYFPGISFLVEGFGSLN